MTEPVLGDVISILQKGAIRKIEGNFYINRTNYVVTAYGIGEKFIRIDLKEK